MFEAFAGGGAAEAQDVPAQIAAVLGQDDAAVQAGDGAVEDDALLRQPFQRGAGTDTERHGL
jgi:hypothetical protein